MAGEGWQIEPVICGEKSRDQKLVINDLSEMQTIECFVMFSED